MLGPIVRVRDEIHVMEIGGTMTGEYNGKVTRTSVDGRGEPGSTSKVVTARKQYWCFEEFAHDRHIYPGDRYVRWTIFPNHDFFGDINGKPYTVRMCAQCAGLD